MNRIGIIDIGSNSIKSLLVHNNQQGTVTALAEGRSPTRIGSGLSDTPPRIREKDVAAAANAINQLIAEAKSVAAASSADNKAAAVDSEATNSDNSHTTASDGRVTDGDCPFELYATSAIREASNREQVVAELSQRCNAPLTVLSGEEEATLIGWAARSMPELAAVNDMLIADLGGGSLELLHLQEGRVRQQCSLHLGAVRLTTEFFAGGLTPVSAQAQTNLATHIDSLVAASGFDFTATRGATLVGSGGALSALHHMDCFSDKEQHSTALGDDIPLMPVAAMQALCASACAQCVSERIEQNGFPKNRADIMPAALLVLLHLAKLCHGDAYAYCSHNLRFGLAAWKVYQSRSNVPWTPADPIPAITIHADHG